MNCFRCGAELAWQNDEMLCDVSSFHEDDDEAVVSFYHCPKCGASYTLTPCRDGQHVDEDFDFVCERCHSKISFRENWPHYIVGLPMYWLRKALSWLLDGRKGILKF